MKFLGIVEGALTKEHFLELIDWVEAHTTKNVTCRGGFFRGGLVKRLYKHLLRRFFLPPLYFLICRGGFIKPPQ
jgi:hypothetical protein